MGKLIQYVLTITVLYILFIITGQLVVDSNFSLITGLIFDPSIVLTSAWWLALIKGTSGISALIVTGGVIAGIATRNSDITIFSAMASVLVLMAGDFLIIYDHLRSINNVLALMIMSPIIITFVLIVVDWLRGKD